MANIRKTDIFVFVISSLNIQNYENEKVRVIVHDALHGVCRQ